VSDQYWCTEGESVTKLKTIVDGHGDIFEELRRFQNAGNVVTLTAGNHDVDLYWPAVQKDLRRAAGDGLRFELGSEWIDRYGGALQIGHGHMHDPANRFKHWDQPILGPRGGAPRLEMCPGTLFMVKLVNKMEARYPFADNLLPVTKLAAVLLRDDKAGLASIGWALMAFVGGSPLAALHASPGEDVGKHLLDHARSDANFRAAVATALADAGRSETLRHWRSGLPDEATLAATMFELLGRIDEARWRALFEKRPGAVTLGAGDDKTLAAVGRAAFEDGKMQLRTVAQDRIDATGAAVVVMGHTHQPDRVQLEGGTYFNPGSWIRYLELERGQRVRLDDLKDESRYPYELNCVRVAPGVGDRLDAMMLTFERQEGR
jgi:UDP-2,3-diacylglucosamine pyrophosphatase LpxH